MTGWTKGEWSAERGPREEWHILVKYGLNNERFTTIARISAWQQDAEANAHLLATSKELYEALEASDEVLVATFAQVSDPQDRRGWSDDDAWRQHQRNQAALFRARGDTQEATE